MELVFKSPDPINTSCKHLDSIKSARDFQKRFGIPFLDIAGERLRNRRAFLAEGRLCFQPLTISNFIPPFCPISPGLFKGTYSAHGIEIVNLVYEDCKTVTGWKVSGDPNVPCNQVSFQGYLNRPMALSNQEKGSFDLIKEYMIANAGTDCVPTEEGTMGPSSFNIPHDCRVDAPIKKDVFQSELWRFQAKCQIAWTGFVDPRFIAGNIIIFSKNVFGVIFIDVQSFGIFERKNENLLGTTYREVLCKDPSDVQ